MTDYHFTIATNASPTPTHIGVARTDFGALTVSWNPDGLCQIEINSNIEPDLERDDVFAETFATWLFGSSVTAAPTPLIILTGTPFQKAVLLAVAMIPRGETRTYSQIANTIGHSKATRAVGSAVASNRFAILIPCHRVIRSNGAIGDYRWGTETKAALLSWENFQPIAA